MPNRPIGREKHVTSGGSGVHKGGLYSKEGPVGRTQSGKVGPSAGSSQGAHHASAGPQGSRPMSGGPQGSHSMPGGPQGTHRVGGSGQGGFRASGGFGGGGTRRGGCGCGGLIGIVIIIAVLFFGGKSGLTGLFHSGGSSGSSSGSSGYSSSSGSSGSGSSYGGSSSYTGLGHGSGGNLTYGGSSGSSDYTTYDSSGSSGDLSSSTVSAGDSGIDLSSLSDLFGIGVTNTAAGISTGWNDGRDNRGVLNTSVATGSRQKYTKLQGGGRDTVTLMIYMCGTDLEQKSGMGTSDLGEMVGADISDHVNVLVYTGGCTNWRNDVVSAKTNQIYRVRKGGLERLVADDGDRVMTDPATLTRFIKWSASNFPASRYQLIFWDHGSGSLQGYGYDQKHKNAGSMDLTQIRDAVKNGGVKFDFIGFDACLMATVENALALSDYADYLIASEETEPGTGWYYTNWLDSLSDNTSIPTTELGKQIIDDFVDVSARKARGQDTTLSLVDLAELENTFPTAFSDFAKDTCELIQENAYKTVSSARSSSREFASSNRLDQVDLTDLAWKMGTEEGRALANVLLGSIKYNRTSSGMCNSYGLSIYFPGSRLSKVDSMVGTYRSLGIDSDYTKCIQQYAAVSTSGQVASGGSTSIFDLLSNYTGGSSSGYGSSSVYGGSSISDMGTDLLIDLVGSLLSGRSVPLDDIDESNSHFLKECDLTTDEIVHTLRSDSLDSNKLVWDTSTGLHIMQLEQEEWDKVSQLTVNMLFDDGEGFIDLGEDNTFTFTETGDLQGETDRTWLSINNEVVAFYHISTTMEGDSSTTVGRVPCLLNGDRVNLIIAFDAQNPYGYIAGARYDYVEGETETLAKAMTELKPGDELRFLCDYYSYNGTYSGSHYLGNPVTVEDVMVISNTDVGEGGALITYHFKDLYGQSYWTEPIFE